MDAEENPFVHKIKVHGMTDKPYRYGDMCPVCLGNGFLVAVGVGTGALGHGRYNICKECAGHGRLSEIMAQRLNDLNIAENKRYEDRVSKM